MINPCRPYCVIFLFVRIDTNQDGLHLCIIVFELWKCEKKIRNCGGDSCDLTPRSRVTHIDGLVQDCSNSSALAMELLHSYAEPSIYTFKSLLWRHNGRDGVSNHPPHDCLPGADQRKHQSSTSPAFVRDINRWPVNSPHKGKVTRKMFPFDDVIK